MAGGVKEQTILGILVGDDHVDGVIVNLVIIAVDFENVWYLLGMRAFDFLGLLLFLNEVDFLLNRVFLALKSVKFASHCYQLLSILL